MYAGGADDGLDALERKLLVERSLQFVRHSF